MSVHFVRTFLFSLYSDTNYHWCSKKYGTGLQSISRFNVSLANPTLLCNFERSLSQKLQIPSLAYKFHSIYLKICRLEGKPVWVALLVSKMQVFNLKCGEQHKAHSHVPFAIMSMFYFKIMLVVKQMQTQKNVSAPILWVCIFFTIKIWCKRWRRFKSERYIWTDLY